MARTDRELSTFARRAVLAGVCALPFAAPAATLAMAASGGPSTPPDPVFAAIDAHKAALVEWLKAVDAESDLDEVVLARCGQLRPGIVVEGLPGDVAEVHNRWQIDMIVATVFKDDAETRERIRDGLYDRLDVSEREIAAAKAELGHDAQEARYEETNDAERIALDVLLETVPTTPSGLLAMLEHISKREIFGDGIIERWQAEALLETLTAAARRISNPEGSSDV